ncbi:hypothetical protein CJ214_05630 [Peptoniphilus lacrimalis]|nr:hypothetical protein CJ214_05630 [Peptoniphilus lacrimalis]
MLSRCVQLQAFLIWFCALLVWYCARFEYFSPRKSRRYAPLLLLVEKYIKPSEYLELFLSFNHRDSRFFLLSRRVIIKVWRCRRVGDKVENNGSEARKEM